MKAVKTTERTAVTPTGLAFFTIAALVQLAAVNTGTNLLYLVAGGVMSFLLITWMFSRRSLRGLTVVRKAPASVHRDDSFGLIVRLENTGKFVPLLSLRLRPSVVHHDAGLYVPKISAGKAAVLRLTDLLHKRGVHRLADVQVGTGIPLGLWERHAVFTDDAEVIVYPRVRAVRWVAMEQMQGGGDAPRTRAGDGDEFFSLREYIPGDDPRRIVWRASARTGTLIVRQLDPNTSRNVYIVFDSRRARDNPEFEQYFEEAVDIVASLAVSFLNRQYAVAVVCAESSTPLGEGSSHGIKILDMLARIDPSDPSVGAGLIAESLEHVRAAYIFVSPDPAAWGRPSGMRGIKFLDPREVIRA